MSGVFFQNLSGMSASTLALESFADEDIQAARDQIEGLGVAYAVHFSTLQLSRLSDLTIKVLAEEASVDFDLLQTVGEARSIYLNGVDEELFRFLQPLLFVREFELLFTGERIETLAKECKEFSLKLLSPMPADQKNICVGIALSAIEADLKDRRVSFTEPEAFAPIDLDSSQAAEYQRLYEEAREFGLPVATDFINSKFLKNRGVEIKGVYPPESEYSNEALPTPFLPLYLHQIAPEIAKRKGQLLLAIQPDPAHALKVQLHEPFHFIDANYGEYKANALSSLLESLAFHIHYAYPDANKCLLVEFTS